jgi:hypothetical protein
LAALGAPVVSDILSLVRNVDWLRVYVPLGSELISATGFKPVDQIFFQIFTHQPLSESEEFFQIILLFASPLE